MKVPARIVSIRQETPTVKSFRLDPEGPDFPFLPGQWIDCVVEIDGRPEVAGYSMTSSPLKTDTIEIAVKLVGVNPVTHYLHQQAREGDVLYIQKGGDFFYTRDMGGPLVLIAGGIGITPIMSIMRYVSEAAPDVDATLLYSASTPSELLFHDDLAAMSRESDRIRCFFTVTRPTDEEWQGRVGRIDAGMLRECGADLGALFYLCGPPAMIQDTLTMLRGLGVPEDRISYEQWW